jgi:hypothetical protein
LREIVLFISSIIRRSAEKDKRERRRIKTGAGKAHMKEKDAESGTKKPRRFALCIKKNAAFVYMSENAKKEPNPSKNRYNRSGAGTQGSVPSCPFGPRRMKMYPYSGI